MNCIATVTRIILYIICFCISTRANQLTDSVPLRHSIHQRPDHLFVQTDKHLYGNGEHIWFSASLLNVPAPARDLHQLLCIVLIPADTRKPAVHQKYLLLDGMGYGSLRLPDTIAPGEYKLVAYTNIIGKDSLPSAIFTQALTIHSSSDPNFIAACTLLEDGEKIRDLLITVRNKTSNLPVRDAELTIWCGNSKIVQAKTDRNGMFRQSLHALPPGDAPPIVKVKIKHDREYQYLQKPVTMPEKKRNLVLQFYPEGGRLLPGVPGYIGWQSLTDQGEPLAVKAVLYKNKQAIDTMVTNEWGMGRFIVLAEQGATYRMKVLQTAPGIQIDPAGYALPAVADKGLNMHLDQALSGDSLVLLIYSAGYSNIRLAMHNFKTVFVDQSFAAKENGTRVLLVLDSVPKGLSAVTLLDEYDRPLAQRLFFAHYDKKATVDIQPDKRIYNKREKVTLRFQLSNHQPGDSGYATIACAEANRMLTGKHQDIESFAFLEAPLQSGPLLNKRYGNTNWMENVLLNTTGRAFSIQPDSAVFGSPIFTGYVTPAFGKIRKPVKVSILGNYAGASVITTNATGHFQCSYADLLVLQDKKLLISANESSTTSNLVRIEDPFLAVNEKLAQLIDFRSVDAGKYVQYAQDLFAKSVRKAKELAAVTVVARTRNMNPVSFGSNRCGDYVCSYQILNCPNHRNAPGNYAPVKGHLYTIKGQGMIAYWGCSQEDNKNPGRLYEFDGIKIGNEFYAEDFSQKTGNSPENISTLYFSPLLVFDANGKAECSFYTGDIPGVFRITVNGMVAGNLFYGTGTIEVK